MREDLVELFEQLRRDEKQAMTEIYKRTSAHIYGIIFRLVPHEEKASRIMASFYKMIWERRNAPLFSSPLVSSKDMLNVLRAKAHRAAIEFKLTHQVIKSLPRTSDNLTISKLEIIQGKLADMNDKDVELLRMAYLDAFSLNELASHFNTSTTNISRRLSDLALQLKDPLS